MPAAGFVLLLVTSCERPIARVAELPPPTASAIAVVGPSALADRAEACFADPACPLDRASADLTMAADRGADVDCFRFHDGIGVAADAPRARACFARKLGRETCEGSSPELARLVWATMMIEGRGGPPDRAGAEAALAGCFADVSVEAVLALKAGGTTDFCRDIGGTTLAMSECNAIDRARADFAWQRWRKSIEPALDAERRARLRAADAAFARYVEAESARAGDAFRGGTLANLAYGGVGGDLWAARAAALGDGGLPAATNDDVRRVELAAKQGSTVLRHDLDAEGAALLDASDAAFVAYLDAEIDAALARGQAGAPLRARLLRDRVARLTP
jgi:hypothetical protein